LFRASDIDTFRDVLENKITKIKDAKSVVTSIVLSVSKGSKCAN